jgi:hypothetical protein
MKKREHASMDEISMYEEGYPTTSTTDSLQWWTLHEAEFPGIARMSADMFCILATTARVERLFLQAKLILTDGRSVLDSEIAGKIASLGSWFRDFDFGK